MRSVLRLCATKFFQSHGLTGPHRMTDEQETTGDTRMRVSSMSHLRWFLCQVLVDVHDLTADRGVHVAGGLGTVGWRGSLWIDQMGCISGNAEWGLNKRSTDACSGGWQMQVGDHLCVLSHLHRLDHPECLAFGHLGAHLWQLNVHNISEFALGEQVPSFSAPDFHLIRSRWWTLSVPAQSQRCPR